MSSQLGHQPAPEYLTFFFYFIKMVLLFPEWILESRSGFVQVMITVIDPHSSAS